MAKSSGGSSSGSSSSGRSSGGSYTPRPSVSPARLHQPSGTSFGGYAKVANPDGSFRMKPTGK